MSGAGGGGRPSAVPVTEFAPAKINLHLHVTGRRADGYHLLDSLVVFAPFAADRLDARAAPALSLALAGPFASDLADAPADDNLVLRAARAIDAGAVALRLDKRLPVASGIGGGSADAAATLRALGRLRGIAPERLAVVAPTLGADVPVCLRNVPARMGGVGDVLGPAPALPPFGLVLVNPGVPVATAAVFRAARTGEGRAPAILPAAWPDARALAATLRADTTNDLEPAARGLAPPIGDVLAALGADPRCLLARMSGSGATCFGVYADAAAAESASAAIRRHRPDWWVGAGSV